MRYRIVVKGRVARNVTQPMALERHSGYPLNAYPTTAAAQPAHAADTASHPQDRRFFESWNRPIAFPIYGWRRG
jgi:hypothetical protein